MLANTKDIILVFVSFPAWLECKILEREALLRDHLWFEASNPQKKSPIYYSDTQATLCVSILIKHRSSNDRLEPRQFLICCSDCSSGCEYINEPAYHVVFYMIFVFVASNQNRSRNRDPTSVILRENKATHATNTNWFWSSPCC